MVRIRYRIEAKLIRGLRWASISALAENLFQSQALSLLRYVSTDVAKLGLLEWVGRGIWGGEAILCYRAAIEGSGGVETRLYIEGEVEVHGPAD